MLFHFCPVNLIDAAYEYAKMELYLAIQIREDVKLTAAEKETVLLETIKCMGANGHPKTAPNYVALLDEQLKNSNPKIRLAALKSILNQIMLLDRENLNANMWTILPFYADPDKSIQQVFKRFISKSESAYQYAKKKLTSHPQDNTILKLVSFDDIFAATLKISQFIDEHVHEMDHVLVEKPVAEDNLYLANITESLLSQFQSLGQEWLLKLSDDKANEVIYKFQNRLLMPIVNVTLTPQDYHRDLH
jgi:hypothetical protein